MSLTANDLKQITNIVEGTVERTVERVVERVIDSKGFATKIDLDQVESRLTAKMASKVDLERVESRLKASMASKTDLERTESRLAASMSLLQRDAFARLDDHQGRITHLEKSQA